jgi:hypothetical protein
MSTAGSIPLSAKAYLSQLQETHARPAGDETARMAARVRLQQRETFAYACEAYSRILELADGPQARRKLYQELESGPQPGNALACAEDYLEALRAAIAARNGWKRILHACAPPSARRTRSQHQAA